jgi:cell division protein ZapB
MDAELGNLEDKVAQLASLCRELRDENRGLRQKLLLTQQQNQGLLAKVEGSKQRLTAILAKLPEDVE